MTALSISALGQRATLAQSTVDSATPAAAGDTFVDDRGIAVPVDPVPERIVSHILAASALWDFGLESDAIFGPTRKADGTPEAYVGDVDIDALPNIGEETFEFDIEAYIELGGDLLVGVSYNIEDPENVWSIRPEGVQSLNSITPIAVFAVNHKPLPDVIERYGAFAASLGIDIDTPEIQDARAAFDAASSDLREAISAKPDLTVLVLSANADAFYPVAPTPADLVYFADLGLNIVTPDEADVSGVSYEQVMKYPADLILNESRSGWFTAEELAEHPTMSQHPAVQAGQIGTRSNTYVASYGGFVPVLERLTETIRESEVILED